MTERWEAIELDDKKDPGGRLRFAIWCLVRERDHYRKAIKSIARGRQNPRQVAKDALAEEWQEEEQR